MFRKISIILSILPLVFLTLIVFHFSLDVSYWDQWEFVPILQKSYQGNLTFNDFWIPHNEHRPVFPRLIMLGLARLSGWNIRWELTLNILLAIGIYTVVLKSFLKLKNSKSEYRNSKQYQISNDQNVILNSFQDLLKWIPKQVRNDTKSVNLFRISDFVLLIYLSIIIFSLTQWENWVWGWQMQIFLNVFAVTLGLYFLTRSKYNKLNFIVSILSGIIATFSFANGLLFWPLGLLILLTIPTLAGFNPSRYKKIFIWFTVSLLVYLSYFSGLESGFDIYGMFMNPLSYLYYVTAFLGAPVFGLHPSISAVFGLLGILLFISLSIIMIRSKNIKTTQTYFFFSLGLYAIFTALFTGLGRFSFGGLQAISSRYITFGNLFWFANIIFLYKAKSNRTRGIALLIIFLITATSLYRIKTVIKRYNDLSTAQAALFTGTNDKELGKLYYSGEVVKERSEFLRSNNLSLFRK